ncbi:MAG: uridine phosphorylase [Caldisericia bacterium]
MEERFKSADRPETNEGKQYHIDLKPGDLSHYVLMPGDPGRVDRILKTWDEGKILSFHREYKSATGKFKGVEISALSTGIGGPSLAIAVEEAARIGVHTFIRVGTTGSIQENISLGDIVIINGAVRLDGTSHQYVRAEYPAIASFEVTLALIEACEELGYNYHVGVGASTDSFYSGQGRPGFNNYLPSFAKEVFNDLKMANVMNFEMESATLFTLTSIYKLRAGALCVVIANRVTNEFQYMGEEKAINVANYAVKILNEWDQIKKKKGKKFFYPGLIK